MRYPDVSTVTWPHFDPEALPAPKADSPSLFAVFAGPLEAVTQPALGQPRPDRPDRHAPDLATLSDPAFLAERQRRFARTYPGGDRRAVASIWSKWLYNAVLPTFIGLLMTEGRGWTGERSAIGVVLDSDARPERLWLRSPAVIGASVSVGEGLERLMTGLLAPVIETLARESGASRNVFWSNAGNVVEYLVGEMAQHPAITLEAQRDSFAFLDRRHLPSGERNPLWRPVRYRSVPTGQGEIARLRRVCCIRYLLPATATCANCPLNCRQRDAQASGTAGPEVARLAPGMA
ncbi:MAG: siderophore-iron reductase FhuF [Halothiobacillaceae bacterium]|nr:siderophore-iron reductase FhuF [Halothiobacillaceae bacterium]